MTLRYTYVGAATAILEIGSVRLLTDPAFDPPGGKYRAAPLPGFGCRKLTGPALEADAVGPVDAVLLSHDHHFDNLDAAGRELLASAKTVLTTPGGARRLKGNAKGLKRWEVTTIVGEGGEQIRVTATPARHGPPGARITAGAVTGFCLAWEGQRHGELYLSGDTRLFRGVHQVAKRHRVSAAVLNLGPAQFKATGPMRYTFDAKEAAAAARVLQARTIIPNHYEGFTHYKELPEQAERVLAEAGIPVKWVARGTSIDVEV
jgi:L-ascorbate metabolism protein UlaG (beta-lactamase superfamily)